MNNYCIIMAGGIGSRFWPLSKDNYPKQFLDILGTGKSFIRSTYERFSPVIPDENFLVVTNKAYKHLVLEHLPMLRPDQVLCEPARRNTAPCIAYAAYHIQSRCSDANIVVTPADHLVTNETEFQRIIRLGFDFLAKQPNALMTIGIKPSRPETGYGYIQVPKQDLLPEVVKVEMFKEKPDYDTAVKFVAEGNYFWNSGIFLWTLDGIMKAFKQYLPEMVEVFEKGIYNFGTPEEQDFINDHFVDCPNISLTPTPSPPTLAGATSAHGVRCSPTPRKTKMATPNAARWSRWTTKTPLSTSRKAPKPWWKAWKTIWWPIATTPSSSVASTTSNKSKSGSKV